MIAQAEYIWLDGCSPTQEVRSKTRIVDLERKSVSVDSFPEWSFDGSSTYQAQGSDSDLLLKPVCFLDDPVRGKGNYLVLCEVFNADGTPHSSNKRAHLRNILDKGAAKEEAWFGFEQEYTLFYDIQPLGWPKGGYPAPQGPFYCGVGTGKAYGRDLVEAHTQACIDAGLMIYGINAEVMPSQWEFQIGYRGFDNEPGDPLTVADHLWIARWLLNRIAEKYDVIASLDPKPVKGDWNGAGAHTNFSTKAMREKGGMKLMEEIIQKLALKHSEHINDYGADLESRLTGLHETSSITEFRSGVADRGASIRIPRQVQEKGCGYLEDRRPGANCDPYVVCARILDTITQATPAKVVA